MADFPRLLALAQQGAISLEPEIDAANMHCHTFFSFNAYGYSPTALVWLANLLGMVNFLVKVYACVTFMMTPGPLRKIMR